MTKFERLQEMVRLYRQRPFSDIDMAERLSTSTHTVDRTTVFRYRKELEREEPIVPDDMGRWYIDRTRYLSDIRVNVREGLSLYLAARRASQQTQSGAKDAAKALEKLAAALRRPMTERLVKAAAAILQQRGNPERDAIFEAVANAWVEGRRLRIRYQGLAASRAYEDVISPYLVEPSPWSDAVYVIGPSDKLRQLVSYRLDRIEHAFVSGEVFELPADFDDEALLRHAWGIWRSDEEPVLVQLKFMPGRATKRLKESVWHPLEEVKDLEDGGCIWQAPIAEWREMVPWVRSWGADVEVLGPQELQNQIAREIRNLARLYGIETTVALNTNALDYDQQRANQLFRKRNTDGTL